MKDEFDLREDGDFATSPTFTLYDEELGKDAKFVLLARTEYKKQLYYALAPIEDAESYVILHVSEDGEDIVFTSIDDDVLFEELADIFDEMLADEMDYDA